MKILTISAQKPNSTGSGVYLSELMKSFKKKGIENAIVCGIDRDDKVDFGEDAIVYPVYYRTEDLPFPVAGMSDLMPYESTRYKDLTPLMQQQFEKVFTEKIRYAIEEFRPDLILCHHLYLLTALVREYFPEQRVGALCHGSDLRQFMKNPMQRDRISDNMQKLDVVFALHDDQKKMIADLYHIRQDKILVIGTGYNSDIFFNKNYEKNADEIRLIFAGKICEKKGVFCLLNALDRVKTNRKLRLSVAGGYSDASEYGRIEELARSIETEVEFIGKLSQTRLAEEFNRSDIFVLPSFYEGLPLVVVEAMACGLKVVVTDLPGVRPWINENVKNSGTVFVDPPVMDHVDEASLHAQEIFTQDLTAGLQEAIDTLNDYQAPDTSGVSWDYVADKVVQFTE